MEEAAKPRASEFRSEELLEGHVPKELLTEGAVMRAGCEDVVEGI